MSPQAMSSQAPRFLDAGEAALVVEFGQTVDPVLNDRVLALDAALDARPLAGITEHVPTYRSLMIHYDPLSLSRAGLIAHVGALIADAGAVGREARHPATWWLPVCYAPETGEDLAEAAAVAGLSPEKVVALHASATYRIYMYGFSPGFAYLGGLPAELAIPRRSTPRPPHADGAIMIGGGLGCVSPLPMPTGWYVLGRTPERVYAPERQSVFMMEPGDLLHFEPVDLATFRALERRVADGEIVARKETP